MTPCGRLSRRLRRQGSGQKAAAQQIKSLDSQLHGHHAAGGGRLAVPHLWRQRSCVAGRGRPPRLWPHDCRRGNQAGYETEATLEESQCQECQSRLLFQRPAKIAHILEKGRSSVDAGTSKGGGSGKKALYDPRTGRFFTRSHAAIGRNFIEQVEQAGTAQAIVQKAANDVGKLLNDNLKGG